MKSIVLTSIAIAILTGSALAQDGEISPKCDAPRQCEVMWQKAQEALSLVSNMRIRLATDSRIETFAPLRIGSVGAVARKIPSGSSGYEFKVDLECYRRVPCDELERSGRRVFNLYVHQPTPPGATSSTAAPVPAAAGPRKAGEDVINAERVAKEQGCSATPAAALAAKGPGFESYTLACTSGDVMMVRCEFGNCRALK